MTSHFGHTLNTTVDKLIYLGFDAVVNSQTCLTQLLTGQVKTRKVS